MTKIEPRTFATSYVVHDRDSVFDFDLRVRRYVTPPFGESAVKEQPEDKREDPDFILHSIEEIDRLIARLQQAREPLVKMVEARGPLREWS